MTDEINVQISASVFNDVYVPQLENMARVQIMFGGSSSGKSKFKAQQVIIDLMRGGRNYLVCRQVGRTIRGSVSQELNRVITEWNVSSLFSINKTDGTITCVNGYQVIFSGLDDVEKLKSITPAKGAITDVWVEEATETEQASIKQLLKRQRGGSEDTPKRLHMTFNPILQSSWIYTEYFQSIGWTETQTEYSGSDLSILKTTYKDNKFLTAEDRAGLEKEKDPYHYQVYTLGNWGVLGNIIFTNWVVADLGNPDDSYYLPEDERTNRRHGQDFGFSSDPAAACYSHYDAKRKVIYIYGELYETGLTNDMLAERIKAVIGRWETRPRKGENSEQVLNDDESVATDKKCTGTDTITCDSAEPKSIAELGKHGVSARAAKKGKDSVNFGIDWLKQRKIVVDKSCINMQNELRQYHWLKDAGGNDFDPPRPSEKNNHLIDALRYAYDSDMTGGGWFVM